MMKKKEDDIAFEIDSAELDLQSSVPLYAQLVKIIIKKIDEGELQEGSMLPPEMYLCDTLHLSRSTVRKAMLQLEQEGRLIRRRGKGTFVTIPKLRRSLNNMYNFSLEMKMMGLEPHSEIISFGIVKADIVVAKALEIAEGSKVYKCVRLRFADELPILLETAYIPLSFCPDLQKEDLNDSLYALISEYTGYMPLRAVERYDAVVLKDKEAALLQCKARDPAFKIKRVSTNTNFDIFEYSIIIAPGERNSYQTTLNRDNDMFLTRRNLQK